MEEKEDTESNTSSYDNYFEELFRCSLKSLSTNEMETMIAKVLGDAVGKEYEADIRKLDFASKDVLTQNEVEITILIKQRRDLSSIIPRNAD